MIFTGKKRKNKFNFQILRRRLNSNYALLNTSCVIFTFGSINCAFRRFRRKDGAIRWALIVIYYKLLKAIKEYLNMWKAKVKLSSTLFVTLWNFCCNVMKLLLSSMVFRTRSTICINICVGLMANWIVFLYCIVWIVESKFI